MAYTITYKFPNHLGLGEAVAGDNRLRLDLIFTVNKEGMDSVRSAEAYNLRITDWGESDIGVDIDEHLLAVKQYDFKVYDGDGHFDALLFEEVDSHLVLKNPVVKLQIKHSGESTWEEDFNGEISFEPDSILYNPDIKTFSFSALPRTDKLQQYKLHESKTVNNNTIENFALNPLELPHEERQVVGDPKRSIEYWNPIGVITLILKCFQKINPNVNLTVIHNWLFNATDGSTTTIGNLFMGSGEANWNNNIVTQIFGTKNKHYGIENLQDLLTVLGFNFGCIIGMETNDSAFIREILCYDELNLQTLGRVVAYEKSIGITRVDAVRITTRAYYKKTKQYYEYEEERATTWSVPDETKFRGDNILDKETIFWIGRDKNNVALLNPDLYFVQSNQTKWVSNAYRPDMIEVTTRFDGKFHAVYYDLLRGSGQYSRVDRFGVKGLKYSFLKGFNYNGNGYQILRLKKKYAKNRSDIEALYVVESEYQEPTGEDAPPKPFTTLLPSGWYNKYTYVFKILYDELQGGKIDILNIPKGFQLQQIQIYFEMAFDNVTDMYVADNSPSNNVLMPKKNIMNQTRALSEVWKYKVYDVERTVSFYCTGTPTKGSANIFLELLGDPNK